MKTEERVLLNQLGRAFDLISTAHYAIRANTRACTPGFRRRVTLQWADGVARYADALRDLEAAVPPETEPATFEEALARTRSEEAVQRVRSCVLGRIIRGHFVKTEAPR